MKLAGGIFVALLLAACSSGHDVTGTFRLTDSGNALSSSSCHGTGGYSDIAAGAAVTVKDGAGKVLATSRLEDDDAHSSAGICGFTFAVKIPDADFYAFEVGHRGELTYSKDELASRGWAVGFTLGP